MRGSFKNNKQMSLRYQIMDQYYLDRIIDYRRECKDDEYIVKNLGISEEDFEKYRNRLKREGRWN